jgi:hypothetical protein
MRQSLWNQIAHELRFPEWIEIDEAGVDAGSPALPTQPELHKFIGKGYRP